MKIAFTDLQEITTTAVTAFISTFKYTDSNKLEESDELKTYFDYDNSDSDSSDFDFDDNLFGCREVTQPVENMVRDNWELCDPLENVYGETTSNIIKDTVKTVKEESECAGLHFFGEITPGEDRTLISICTEISYWCCCETLKKASPIISEAASNLMY